MAKIWFTSDTHFSHERILKYRKIDTLDNMNNIIIKNWNSNIQPKDTVYFLGDFCFDNKITYDLLDRLNGNIHIIQGNHDKNFIKQLKKNIHPKIKSVNRILDIKIDKIKITLCHFQMYNFNCSHYNAWHLYGHNHKTDNPNFGKCLNVGTDLHNLTPIEWQDVKRIISLRNDNHDFLN